MLNHEGRKITRVMAGTSATRRTWPWRTVRRSWRKGSRTSRGAEQSEQSLGPSQSELDARNRVQADGAQVGRSIFACGRIRYRLGPKSRTQSCEAEHRSMVKPRNLEGGHGYKRNIMTVTREGTRAVFCDVVLDLLVASAPSPTARCKLQATEGVGVTSHRSEGQHSETRRGKAKISLEIRYSAALARSDYVASGRGEVPYKVESDLSAAGIAHDAAHEIVECLPSRWVESRCIRDNSRGRQLASGHYSRKAGSYA